jgi:uncharacterized coiled-coil DUF342 family protein
MSYTNCPFCGEPEETDTPSNITIYRCGTQIFPNNSSAPTLICDLGKDLRREREAHNQTREQNAKLERERDEAQESLKHITEYGTEEINAAVELRQKLATALVERDEARKELEGWRNKWECAVEMAAQSETELFSARKVLLEIANASHFDNIGNWARNKAKQTLKIK